MTNAELEALVGQLMSRVTSLEEQLITKGQFEDNFSGKLIINHEVQFLKKVTDKNGTIKIN